MNDDDDDETRYRSEVNPKHNSKNCSPNGNKASKLLDTPSLKTIIHPNITPVDRNDVHHNVPFIHYHPLAFFLFVPLVNNNPQRHFLFLIAPTLVTNHFPRAIPQIRLAYAS